LIDRRSKPHISAGCYDYDIHGIGLRDYETRVRRGFFGQKIHGAEIGRGVISCATVME
jgi:hypothetical protein